MIMNNILKNIKESNSVAITFHISPDGDSLGSALGLYLGLKKLNKDVYIISKEETPENYKFLPSSNIIDGKTVAPLKNTDIVISLDCGDFKRINGNLKLEDKEFALINIDHHLSNELYGDLNYVDTNSAAVGEIVYQMLKLLGIKLDKEIAECLYTSLVTDTGSFKYSNTTSVTHIVAGDLINTGLDFNRIHRLIFENKKLERIKLYGKSIEKLKLFNKKIGLITLAKKDFEAVGMDNSVDTADVISLAMEIDTVEVAALLKENSEGVKVSLRAKKDLDVRKVAEKFGGGGHTKAAGLMIKNVTLKEAEEIIKKSIEEELI